MRSEMKTLLSSALSLISAVLGANLLAGDAPAPTSSLPTMTQAPESGAKENGPSRGARAEVAFAPERGFYIGLHAIYNSMFGDFDDSVLLFDPNSGDVIDVPEVDDGYGLGIALGMRLENGALELCYQRTMHNTSSVVFGDSEAAYNAVDINWRIDVLKRRIRPYVQLGFGVPWMTINDAVYTGRDYNDATFVGLGVNVGGGASYFITSHLSANAGVGYRYNWFFNAEGTKLESGLSQHSVQAALGLAYTF